GLATPVPVNVQLRMFWVELAPPVPPEKPANPYAGGAAVAAGPILPLATTFPAPVKFSAVTVGVATILLVRVKVPASAPIEALAVTLIGSMNVAVVFPDRLLRAPLTPAPAMFNCLLKLKDVPLSARAPVPVTVMGAPPTPREETLVAT